MHHALKKVRTGLYPARDFQESFMKKAWSSVPLTKDELDGYVVVVPQGQSMVNWRKENLTRKNRRVETNILWCESYEDAVATILRFS